MLFHKMALNVALFLSQSMVSISSMQVASQSGHTSLGKNLLPLPQCPDGNSSQKKAVRSVLGYSPSADRIKAIPRKRNRVGLVSSSSTTETPKQNRPPKTKDANHLLYHFLIERFPNGGIFRTASCEKDPASTEDLKAFVDFCKRKEYSTHPYSAKWLEMTSPISTYSGT